MIKMPWRRRTTEKNSAISKSCRKWLIIPFLALLTFQSILASNQFNFPETKENLKSIKWRHKHRQYVNDSYFEPEVGHFREYENFEIGTTESVSSDFDLSDMNYLRRHLNRNIVNFVMRNVLVDGEIENRLHFNGLTAKETIAGSYGSYLRLREITNGNQFLQIIYTHGGEIQDCDFSTQGKSSRNFLKKLRDEIKSALDEAYEMRSEKNAINFPKDIQKYVRHFENVTVRILKNGARLPVEFETWMDFERLKMECLQRHEQIKYLYENKSKGSKVQRVHAEHTLSRYRRSLREYFMMPGTKWCGSGHIALTYNELGSDRAEDACCRAHDHCPMNILPMRRKFGYINYRPYTVSHCRCDRRAKRSAMDVLRVPGTKWCGKGFTATRYQQLGGYTKTDRCCRAHDLRCPFWVGALDTKYGLFNWRMNTLMHCRCDERFRACLKLADTSVSNMVGKLFFNVVQTKCFILKPTKICTERSWWGKCLRRGYSKQAYLRDNLPY